MGHRAWGTEHGASSMGPRAWGMAGAGMLSRDEETPPRPYQLLTEACTTISAGRTCTRERCVPPHSPYPFPIATRAPPNPNCRALPLIKHPPPSPPQGLIIKQIVPNMGHSVSNRSFPTRCLCWPKTCTGRANRLPNCPSPTMTRRAQQAAANERRALARFYSESLLRRPSRSDNASIDFSFSSAWFFRSFNDARYAAARVWRGLWTNERPHRVVPHQGDEAQGTRRRGCWRRHLRYRQEVSTIMMPPVPGGAKMRLLDARPISSFCRCGRKRGAKAARKSWRSFLRRLPWSWSPAPPTVQLRYGGCIRRYTPTNFFLLHRVSFVLTPWRIAQILHWRSFLPTPNSF